MLRHAVVLAAGRGYRIRETDSHLPKPLQPVAGVSLLKRTLLTLRAAGIEHAHIVVGFLAEQLRVEITEDAAFERAGLTIDFIDNLDYDRSNGVSVLAARGHVEDGFVLSMSDHVYDVSIAELAVNADLASADLHLCVDRRVDAIYDLPDATKVRTKHGEIVDIGKQLTDYDCIDCGVFAVGPALLDALAEAFAERGDCSLSDGVSILAQRRRARVLDIGDAFWQDVDTPGALERVERELARMSR